MGKPSNGNTNANSGKPWPSLVKFTDDRYRNMVFRTKKKLAGSGIVISELLTQKRSTLLKKCYEKIVGGPSERSIWTDNGRILVKMGDRQIVNITKENDIDLFLQNATATTGS